MNIKRAKITTSVLLINLLIATGILAIQPRPYATRAIDDSKRVQEIFALHATSEERIAFINDKASLQTMVKVLSKEKTLFLKELAKNDLLDRYQVWEPSNAGSF